MKFNSILLTDGYKTGHHKQYPPDTTLVYSNFTPRSNKYAPSGANYVVSFGQQMVMRQIHDYFQDFFNSPKEEVLKEIKDELSMYLGADYDVSHFAKLHDLGYLPIEVKIIEEGTRVPIKIPVLTIVNTKAQFYWLPNFLETLISNLLWKPMTSATIADQYRKIVSKWQRKTDIENEAFVDWQCHDFSMRGMSGIDSTIASGLGHLTSFLGSDTLPAISAARKYYDETGFVCGSVNATEHSVMCAGGKESELDTFNRLINTYPTGILSVVSDTWDLWKVCDEILPTLKEKILQRDGKLVIRPDSGDPIDILCGTKRYDSDSSSEEKGLIHTLWDLFGGTVNSQGYRVLNSHIGAIYGDSITLDRAEEICRRLAVKGFASTNVVFGIGSYTYQYNTRDTFGFAMKATYVVVDGEGKAIFKDPVTDNGMKKSAIGLLKVDKVDDQLVLQDQVSWKEEAEGELIDIYRNGHMVHTTTLSDIRKRLRENA